MLTKLKKHISITTCLLFIVIGCAIKHQEGSNRLDTNEVGEPHSSSTHDVGLDTSDEKNPKKACDAADLEKEGLEQHNFGENRAINSSLSGYSNGALIRPTTQKTGPNTYSQRAQDRDDDDDDYDDDDYDDDDDQDDDDDNDDDHDDDDDYDDDDHDDDDDNDDDDYDDDHHYGNMLFDYPTDAGRPSPSFQDDILPILTNRCAFAGCHVAGGPDGIDLRTYDALIAGGNDGAIVIAGNARESELVEQIVEGKMPPNGPPLPAAQIQLIIDWIDEGAKNNLNNETEGKPPIPPADLFPSPDVNRDGVVNILDLIQAALQFGQVGTHLAGDVNGDGKVEVSDLVLISVSLNENAAAPAPPVDDSNPIANYHSSSVKRQFQALSALESQTTPSRGARLAHDLLKAYLSQMKPLVTETKLLPNYPNPFNPETWIPYQLAEAAHVKIHIYDVVGNLVRTLNLGTKPAGSYLSREQAAYWNGRNDMGEMVSSGVYFYTLVVGDYQTTRRMIVAR